MLRLLILAVFIAALAGGALQVPGLDVLGEARDRAQAAVAPCDRPAGVVDIGFSRTKYPHIRAHMNRAIRAGWPRVLTLTRRGADGRRDRALEGIPTRPGYDRDEYPPAVGRTRAATDVQLVPSSENRSHGATLGVKLRHGGHPYCDGTRFRYVFY